MKDKNKERMELAHKTPQTMNPFEMMRYFTKDMERLFENFPGFTAPTFFEPNFTPFRMEFEEGMWAPQIEVLQKNGEFIVRADLPGMTKDDVTVEITDEMLTLSGERKEEKKEEREGFYRTERMYGTFCRQVPLPEGAKTEQASAIFKNGVLEVRIEAPKFALPTRTLEIKEPVQAKVTSATA